MELTNELWEAFGFKKDFGWDREGWKHKENPELQFFEGVSMGNGLGSTEPKTVEELLCILHRYWSNFYETKGREQIQYEMRSILGLEN